MFASLDYLSKRVCLPQGYSGGETKFTVNNLLLSSNHGTSNAVATSLLNKSTAIVITVQLSSTLGAETFADRKFRDFRVFWHFSRKFLPRHNLNSNSRKFLLANLQKILDSRKFFLSNFFRFFKFLRCCSLITPIFSLLGNKTL